MAMPATESKETMTTSDLKLNSIESKDCSVKQKSWYERDIASKSSPRYEDVVVDVVADFVRIRDEVLTRRDRLDSHVQCDVQH